MFNKYYLEKDILYIDINFNFEFSIFKNKKKGSFIDELKKYIKSNKLNNSFNKIVITCSGIVIGSIILLKNTNEITLDNIKYVPSFKDTTTFTYKNEVDNFEDTTIENKNITNVTKNIVKSDDSIKTNQENQSESNYSSSNSIETNPSVSKKEYISIKRSNGQVISIEFRDYIIGVIAAEMPASFNREAIKAQSVLARTYALKAKKYGKTLTDTVSTQAYIDTDQMKQKWGKDFETYYNKIAACVDETSKEYLSYDNDYIEALYHSTNNGKTESSLDVFGNYYPYLISVTSELDKQASSYLRTTTIPIQTINEKLNININKDSNIQVLSYTDGGNIEEISIDGKIFNGRKFRETLGLRSADFDITVNDNDVSITTRGYGHGVGMSQYGANLMANNNYSYKDILSHYYPGTQLKK